MVRRWVALALTLAVVAGVAVYLLARSRDDGSEAADPSYRIDVRPLTGDEAEDALRDLVVFSRVPADAST